MNGRAWNQGTPYVVLGGGDSALTDGFSRLRFAEPFTLFDSKQLWDKGPLFWDEVETDTSGNATSTHDTTKASTTLYVEAQDSIVRQTKTHWNYQPGKSQLGIFTGRLTTARGLTGVTARVGLFTAADGLFWESDSSTLSVVKRRATTDTKVAQTAFNIDRLDGSGNEWNPSGKRIDVTAEHIYFVEYEWLGVGRVRYGVFIDGLPHYCHEFAHFNGLSTVYMSTPNLPVRYEISVAAGGSAATMEHVCSTVISEGGLEDRGINTYLSNGATHVDANTAGTIYACVGVRLNSTHLDLMARPFAGSMLSTTADDFEWIIYLNPTVAGVFTYGSVTNSGLQAAYGATANTVTNGYAIAGGHVAAGTANAGGSFGGEVTSEIWLGSTVAGTADTMVLCVRPHGADADIRGSLTMRELR